MNYRLFHQLIFTLLYSNVTLFGQEDLPVFNPGAKSHLRTWESPHLLPEKYAMNLTYWAIT